MQFSLLALIGISILAMFFGYGFGLFEGRGQGYKKRTKEEATNPALKASLQATIPPPAPAAPPPPVAPPALVMPAQPAERNLLRLAMDATQQPCLDIDGERIDTTQMEPQQRRRLIDLMVLMRPWIENGPVARAQDAPAALQPEPAAVAAAAPPPPVAAVSAPVSTVAATPTPAPAAEPVSAPTTMVGQIDAILQTRMTGTPLATRGIRLVESVQGGAMVVVGLERYAGVGEVPDAEVQAAIRGAIAEWERKYTPG